MSSHGGRGARLLAWTLAGLVAGGGVLWALGRIKLSYYFGAFGVGLDTLDLSPDDLLFESWFVAQNALFVVLLWWVALKTRERWVACVAVLHALLPIASHYAFLAQENPLATFLIRYRHTLLKLLPFAVLALVWTLQRRHRQTLKCLRAPLPPGGIALFTIVVLAWSISAAKHLGSFDAQRVLREPWEHLPRVRLGPALALDVPDPPGELYLLHAGARELVLWDRNEVDYARTEEIRTLVVRRSAVEWVEARTPFRVQPGNAFL